MSSENRLSAALALSVSAIASEHFFSAGMSSPWSVEKFATSDEDKRKVWKLFWQGAAASLVFAIIIGWMLGGQDEVFAAVIGSLAVSAFMWYEYKQATEGTL